MPRTAGRTKPIDSRKPIHLINSVTKIIIIIEIGSSKIRIINWFWYGLIVFNRTKNDLIEQLNGIVPSKISLNVPLKYRHKSVLGSVK